MPAPILMDNAELIPVPVDGVWGMASDEATSMRVPSTPSPFRRGLLEKLRVPPTSVRQGPPSWKVIEGLGWPASIGLFAIPLLLVFATIVYQRSATPAVLAVEITDRYSGVPVMGASIETAAGTVASDETGLASLDVADPPLRVEITADGYEPVVADIDPAGAERWSVALRPARLTGTLVDEQTKKPVAGARIKALGADGSGPEATSGADGGFRLDAVPVDARIRVEAGEYGTIEQAVGQQTRLDLALKRALVAGLVRDAAGAPIEGARISAVDGSATTMSGPDGSYRLLGATAESVVVAASGFAKATVPVSSTGQVDVALEPELIRAIYANLGVLGDPERLGELIEIANTTEINAIVVDVKQDTIYYDTSVSFFRDVPGMVTPAYDPAELLALLDENDIYSIARVVVFKDPVVAEGRPDLAVRDEVTGDLWRDMNGAAWVNAFNEELWQANADLAGELAQLGFDEVQYDYIRFPSDGDLRTAEFGNEYTEDLRRAAITGAVAMGAEQTRANGAAFAIDLFPIIALFGNDQGIGQTLQDLTPLADYVCLMIYPSHYELGNIPTADGHPNDYPGETVTYTLEMAEQVVPGSKQKMRPWLQDFTYPADGFRAYDADDVRAQIDATEEFGASGWLLWNAAGEFEVEALRPEG